MADLVAYDGAYLPVDVLCASGATAVSCYTDGMYGVIWQDIAKLRAAGKGIIPNHERGAGDLLGGYQAGVTAANECMSNVAGWQCPQDGSVAIFYSVDVSVPEWQYAAVGAAFDGIRDAHAGRWKIGCYGQGGLIDYLASTGRTNVKGWLSSSSSYPGYNRFSPNVGAYQLVGSDIPGTDQNIITDAAGLGVWWPEGAAPLGGGTEIDVPLTEAEMDSIAERVWVGYRVGAGKDFAGSVMGDVVAGFVAGATPQLGRIEAKAGTASVDVATLAAALAPLLKTGASVDDVKAIINATRLATS